MSDIIERLSALNTKKQMLFGLLASERFFICYIIFSKIQKFGNVSHLQYANRLIEKLILGESISLDQIDESLEKVYKGIPHMDDFGSVNGSLALNVGGIIYETLSLAKEYEIRRLKDISTFCTDSIDFLILEIEDYDQMDFEKISNHSLMKEELNMQNGIIGYLEKIQQPDSVDIETLRGLQSEREFDKLNLEKIFGE